MSVSDMKDESLAEQKKGLLEQIHSRIQIGGDHYKNMAIQPAEYAEKNKLSFLEGAVVKYVSRHRDKGGRLDLEKAIHCLKLLIEYNYD
jgi:hypothetical protein